MKVIFVYKGFSGNFRKFEKNPSFKCNCLRFFENLIRELNNLIFVYPTFCLLRTVFERLRLISIVTLISCSSVLYPNIFNEIKHYSKRNSFFVVRN